MRQLLRPAAANQSRHSRRRYDSSPSYQAHWISQIMAGTASMARQCRCLLVLALLSLRLGATDATATTRGLVRRRRFGGGAAKKSSGSGSRAIVVQELDPTKINPSNHTPVPGELDLSIIDHQKLTPPRYCYYNLKGNLTQPAMKKPKGGPSLALTKIMAQKLGQPRPCMIYRKMCNQNLTENIDLKGNCCFGDRFLKKFKNDKDPKFVERLPELAPGSLGTCAIVGNADNLLRTKWGPEIDMHDFVVRFNTKMKGFEKHIGTKTDGLWTKPHYVDRGEAGTQKPTKYHIIPKFTPADLDLEDGKPVLVYGPHLNNKWRPIAKEIYARYGKEKKKTDTKPTGGWARMMAMVEMAHIGACSRLDIYGFSSGGGKYFSRSYQVDGDHSINLEHFAHRLIMHTATKGKVCVYGE